MHDSAINDQSSFICPSFFSLSFSFPLSALRVVSVVVVVSIAPGLQFALFFTVYTWPLETHARTHTHSHNTLTHNSPCVGFSLSALLLILHTHAHTHTGRPFLSSCRCGRVPNDIFYTLFLGSPSFRSISQRRVANPKANETKRVLSISTQLTSPQLTQLNTSLNCLRLSFSLCPASACVSARSTGSLWQQLLLLLLLLGAIFGFRLAGAPNY